MGFHRIPLGNPLAEKILLYPLNVGLADEIGSIGRMQGLVVMEAINFSNTGLFSGVLVAKLTLRMSAWVTAETVPRLQI